MLHPDQNGRTAPPHIFNVAPGQLVELRVSNRTTEDYAPPLADTGETDIQPQSGTALRRTFTFNNEEGNNK